MSAEGARREAPEQELFEEFCEEFTHGIDRLRGEHRANLVAGERELARLEALRKKLVESIMEGAGARNKLYRPLCWTAA